MRKIVAPTRRIAFAMIRKDQRLCFVFNGASRQAVSRLVDKMSSFCGGCQIEVEKLRITNGRCYESVVAAVSDPNTDILAEAEWPTIVTRFLQKDMPCEVTYFDNYEKFLNA